MFFLSIYFAVNRHLRSHPKTTTTRSFSGRLSAMILDAIEQEDDVIAFA
jgi:hypothetical protein